jgi:hypothetical protein
MFFEKKNEMIMEQDRMHLLESLLRLQAAAAPPNCFICNHPNLHLCKWTWKQIVFGRHLSS